MRPASVKFVLKWGYAAHLTLLCLVDDAFTRLWVLGSTMLTCAAHQPQGAAHPPSIRPSTRPSTPHSADISDRFTRVMGGVFGVARDTCWSLSAKDLSHIY